LQSLRGDEYFAAMRKMQGFTLTELVVVLLIAAVLAAIGAPGLGQFIANNRIRGELFDLLGDINFARSEAVTRRTRVVMCRSPDSTLAVPSCGGTANVWTTGYLIFASGDTNNTYEAANDTLIRRGLPLTDDVTITTNATSNRNLEFNPDGSTNETGGTAAFYVCDSRGDDFGRQISVFPHGRPEVFVGSSSSPIAPCP
jgi:type IV fimbrial biogenesis protein FimT